MLEFLLWILSTCPHSEHNVPPIQNASPQLVPVRSRWATCLVAAMAAMMALKHGDRCWFGDGLGVTIDDGQKKEPKKKKTCTKTDTSGSFFLDIIFQHLKEAFSFFNWDEKNDPGRVEAGDYSATQKGSGPFAVEQLKEYALHTSFTHTILTCFATEFYPFHPFLWILWVQTWRFPMFWGATFVLGLSWHKMHPKMVIFFGKTDGRTHRMFILTVAANPATHQRVGWSISAAKLYTGQPPHPSLVGALEPWNFMTFHSIWDVFLPIDELHHFSEGVQVGQPPITSPTPWAAFVGSGRDGCGAANGLQLGFYYAILTGFMGIIWNHCFKQRVERDGKGFWELLKTSTRKRGVSVCHSQKVKYD